ncbi:molybdate ABC transporter substrate-binding protein [Nocardioides sp. MAHUQ-72]|uniref:molybdate ABC transporter substrate-binding protein n=1 Tax=unclassified Nocardioides TaxID=2615069 RepID=UPI003617E49C
MKKTLACLSLLALTLPLAACGDDGDDGSGGTTLTVYAAASLTSTFQQVADEFEKEHDGVDVKLSFGGSSDLVTQIREGAPVDVFASADTATMDELVADDLADGDPQDFATNVLEIAVPPGNPAGVTSLRDLTRPGVNLVTCAPEVPCGAAAQSVAGKAGITLDPVSEEQSVTDVLAKVTSGEADAGLVYVTDVKAAGADVEGITFPESRSVVNTYPIVPVADAAEPDLAAEFVDLVLSDTGQAILRDAGFGKP